MKTLRRNARISVIQALYAEIFCKNLDISLFRETYSDENEFHNLDEKYFQILREKILQKSSEFLSVILALAPKFDLEKLPKIHILILMLALTEIENKIELGLDEKMIINEAIEIAKIFSDTAGKNFINGVLGTYIKNRENFANISTTDYQFFS